MGHISLIASYLLNAAEVNSQLSTLLETSSPWGNYIESDFASVKKLEQKQLGGGTTTHTNSDDEDSRAHDDAATSFLEAKTTFESSFPDSFVPANNDNYDILISLMDNRLFTGIDTDEEGFGEEFSDDEDQDDDDSDA